MPAGLQELLFSFASCGGAGLPRAELLSRALLVGSTPPRGSGPPCAALGTVAPGLVLRVPCSPPSPPTPRPEAGDGAAPGEEPALRRVPQMPAGGRQRLGPHCPGCTKHHCQGAPRRGCSGAQVCVSPPRVGLSHLFGAARQRSAQSPPGGPAAEGHVSPWLSCEGPVPAPPSRSSRLPEAPGTLRAQPSLGPSPALRGEACTPPPTASPALGLHAQTQVQVT